MQQYDIVLDKYWVTQSGYFRLTTAVVLGVGITYENILLCHGISEKKKGQEIYNTRVK